MGSVAAMRAIDAVLAEYRQTLEGEALEELPALIRQADPAIELVNESHWIARWVIVGSQGATEAFELRRLDLYELADRYPELDLGW